MKLITEMVEDVEYLTESTEGGKKKLYISGIFLMGECVNRNGRRYPINILENEVNRYIKESVDTRTALGELGHPNGPQINLDRVSHRIVALERDGNNYRGKALITETPMGNIARGLIESGVKLGVSSRGLGSIQENNGAKEVQKDFRLATAADIVADPSAPNAWVDGIMESVDWVFDEKNGWQAVKALEEAQEAIERAASNKTLHDPAVKIAMFESYLNKISRFSSI